MMKQRGSGNRSILHTLDPGRKDVLPLTNHNVPPPARPMKRRTQSADGMDHHNCYGSSPQTPRLRRRRSGSRLGLDSSDHSVSNHHNNSSQGSLDLDNDNAEYSDHHHNKPLQRCSTSRNSSDGSSHHSSWNRNTPARRSYLRKPLSDSRVERKKRSTQQLVEALDNENSALGDITNYLFASDNEEEEDDGSDAEFHEFSPKYSDNEDDPNHPRYSTDDKVQDCEQPYRNRERHTKRRSLGAWLRRKRPMWCPTEAPPPQYLVLLVFVFMALYWAATAYRQVFAVTELLEDALQGEQRLIVHVHKVEQQALHFAKHLQTLNEQVSAGSLDTHNNNAGPQQSHDSSSVDSKLIQAEMAQLQDMEAQLSVEAKSLQQTLQRVAQQALVQQFGEGAVQVILEIDDGDAKKHLAIRLWFDTPHAVWTLVQQVNAGLWNGATFSLPAPGRALVVEPAGTHTVLSPPLDFVEPTERGHERYTLTLTHTHLLIHLQDNQKIYGDDEASVGKIHEGFNVLHSIVTETQQQQGSVRISKATASYLK